MKTLPYQFQIADVRRYHRLGGRVLDASEMGTAKSLKALMYYYRHHLSPTVIVCPPGLRWNWEKEARTHLGLRAKVLTGTRPDTGALPRRHDLLIVGYNVLGQRRSEHNRYGPGWLWFLRKLRPKLIVLDEVHALGNFSSRQTKWTRRLCKNIPHVIALSGTPLTIRPLELWPTLNILWPKEFPNLHRFAHEFCGPKRVPWGNGWDFRGASNMDELHEILKPKMVRRTLEEVAGQMPPKRRSVVPLDIDDRKQYDEAVDDFIRWLARTHGPKRARKALAAERMVRLGYLKRLAAQLKIKHVFGWVDNFLAGSDSKLILFAIHLNILGALRERYGQRTVTIDGSVTGNDRRRAVDKFLGHTKVRLCLGQIEAAGTGWSAKGVSDTAMVEFPWAPGRLTQAEGRARGIGRGKRGVSSTSTCLVARGTIEEHLVELLQERQRNVNRVLDGEGRGDELSIYDMLCDRLKETIR